MIVEMDLKDLYIPQGLLPRQITGTIQTKVEEYAEMIKNGVEFDPILVWKNPKDGKYWIIDGNHRYKAHELAGRTTIKAKLIDCKDEKDFRKQAIKANLKHGIPLTKQEKIINARLMYQDGEPIEEILSTFGVSERTVYNWLKDLIDEKKTEKEQLKQKAWELRKKGYSQYQIAKELGIPRETIKNWEREWVKNANLQNLPTHPEHHPSNQPQTFEEEELEETPTYEGENIGELWNKTGWGQVEEETEEIQEEQEIYKDTTTQQIKQLIDQLRKKGYNKWQIIKYLVDGEDIEGYTFDQIAKAFDTDTIAIEELYNEAIEMGIKTPRPYQKGIAGRKPKDTSTAFDHEAQFEQLISDAIDYLAKDIYDISLRWGREKAEIYIARVVDWLKNDGEKCIDRNAQ